MFQRGAYPGVDYRVLGIYRPALPSPLEPSTLEPSPLEPVLEPVFEACEGCVLELRPLYPLVKQLERPWPVSVPEAEVASCA